MADYDEHAENGRKIIPPPSHFPHLDDNWLSFVSRIQNILIDIFIDPPAYPQYSKGIKTLGYQKI